MVGRFFPRLHIKCQNNIMSSSCKKCGEKYTTNINKSYGWCKRCQIDNLKGYFTNWTNRNEKIDIFIQEMQLKIDRPGDIVVEWIPYYRFSDIEEIGRGGFATVYSAIWIGGPLKFNSGSKKYTRNPDYWNYKVALKCLHNSQNITNEFLNEVRTYSIKIDDNILKVYGVSQNPDTKDYIMVLQEDCYYYCKKCVKKHLKWCKPCQIDNLKGNFPNWTSRNKKIDSFIQEMQLKIDSQQDILFEWIPYNQFSNIKEIGKGGFATVYSAIWKDGPLKYDDIEEKYVRISKYSNKQIALKCLHNSQNITNEFLNEIKAYSITWDNNILKVYGISQNPVTKDYIMVLYYAEGGSFNNWIKRDYSSWYYDLYALELIIVGLRYIHEKKMIHHDFHIGNILLKYDNDYHSYISDMGLCREFDNVDSTKIYGVMPYVAPEVLRGKPYTQAADIYSFGMIMYFVATGRQPFADCAHDEVLAMQICNGIRPEITEKDAPKCYIDLMKKCWDLNSDNRPNTKEIRDKIKSFKELRSSNHDNDRKISKQFEEAYKYKKANLLTIENNQTTTHPQAIYTSRLLNPYTKDLPKYDNIDNNSVEFIDFTKLH